MTLGALRIVAYMKCALLTAHSDRISNVMTPNFARYGTYHLQSFLLLFMAELVAHSFLFVFEYLHNYYHDIMEAHTVSFT